MISNTSHANFKQSLVGSYPIKSIFTDNSLLSPIPNVFDRLQADTEMRLRSRMDCYSVPRQIRLRSKSPIENLLISRNTMSRCESHEKSLISNALKFKPTINPHSELIFKNKHLEKSKITKSRQQIYDDDEYSNPAEIEESANLNQKKNPNFQTVINLKPNSTQQQLHNKEILTDETSSGAVTDRKYVPMFSKPFDISKILYKKYDKPKVIEKNVKNKEPTKVKKPEIRPLLRPISDSNLRIEDGKLYQQIVKDRIQKGIKPCK
jgi:hypothetical protein